VRRGSDGLGFRAHEDDLFVANEELSARLLEWNPIGAVSTVRFRNSSSSCSREWSASTGIE
jgi:hypothetical protein